MFIINNNYNKSQLVQNNSKFTVVFQDDEECNLISKEIDLLTSDDSVKIWDAFQGEFAQKLLSYAIDGLIVFLSCQQNKNVISGEFFSLDKSEDNSLFASYIHEAGNNALVDIDGSIISV